jgi:putative intracellular protease/amidase
LRRERLSFSAFLAATLLILARVPAASAAHLPHSRAGIRVGIVLFDGVEPIDYAGPYEVFAQAGFGVATVTADGKPVTGMGLEVSPDYSFASAPHFDVLVVPGGDVDRAARDPALLAFIRRQAVAARQVLSVCTGAYTLAATGLLDGLRATTYTESVRDMAAQYPRIHVVRDARWVDDGRIVTSAGLTTGIAAALHVVAKLQGTDVARSVAARLEYAWQPNPRAGFVRGDLADRYLPDLSHVRWPKDAHFGSPLAVGDGRHWRIQVRIATSAPAQALLAKLDDAVLQTPGWRAAPSLGPHHFSEIARGRRIELGFSSRPAARSGSYEIAAALRVRRPEGGG